MSNSRVGFIVALMLAVLRLVGCAARPPVPPTDRPAGLILFVPGFKGTALADRSGRRIWVTAEEAIFGTRSLALPVPEIGITNAELLTDGLLTSVPVIPGLYRYDVYGGTLDTLERAAGGRFEVRSFPYDWRRSIEAAARSLASVVDAERRRGRGPIVLVGHSMGGLVVAHYLRYGGGDPSAGIEWIGTRSIDAAVIAAAPFRGSLEIFHDIEFGEQTGLNESLLDSAALSSFESSYELLPFGTYRPDEVDPLAPSFWLRSGWGLLSRERTTEELRPVRERFVLDRLSGASTLFSALHRPAGSGGGHRRKLLVIRGTGTLTADTVPQDEDTGLPDFDAVRFTDGDGVVTAGSSTLPTPYERAHDVKDLRVEAEHQRVLESTASFKAVRRLLTEPPFASGAEGLRDQQPDGT